MVWYFFVVCWLILLCVVCSIDLCTISYLLRLHRHRFSYWLSYNMPVLAYNIIYAYPACFMYDTSISSGCVECWFFCSPSFSCHYALGGTNISKFLGPPLAVCLCFLSCMQCWLWLRLRFDHGLSFTHHKHCLGDTGSSSTLCLWFCGSVK